MGRFTPSLHPRGKGGRFVKKGGSSSKAGPRRSPKKSGRTLSKVERNRRTAVRVGTGVIVAGAVGRAHVGVKLVKFGAASGYHVTTAVGATHIAVTAANAANDIHHLRKVHGHNRIKNKILLDQHTKKYEKRAKVLRRANGVTAVVAGQVFFAHTEIGRASTAAFKAGVRSRAARKNAARTAQAAALKGRQLKPGLKVAKKGLKGAYKITSAGGRIR